MTTTPPEHPRPVAVLLVANRGEIARRVMRTCRTLGIGTVAVHAPGEEAAAHVAEADTAVALPVPTGGGPVDAYLDADAVVAAARTAGADAVHPGYGFLSENPALARAVTAAGLTWVGPGADAIEAMGSKTRAKETARAAGVPVSAALDPEDVRAEDLPVLVKASAGGGGRGMRVVRDLAELPGRAAAARAEAAAAFGDPAVFCEPYVEHGRHIEVQILADSHGTVWAVGERDCSVQRRHQKVIEEAPAPGLPEEVRRDLHEAARGMARAIGYVGAGTAEFLVPVRPPAGEEGNAFGAPVFLEMNTRLQVEHPVTECVTGLDLVEWQIRIAEGEPLPAGGPPAPAGHAVEARLYAEDPRGDWRPRTGVLTAFDVPAATARFAPPAGFGVRLDSGVEAGDTVGTDFDPMLAKVVAHGRDRRDALRRLSAALAGARVHGVGTNRDLLVRALRHPVFAGADARPWELHTGFLTGDRLTALATPLAAPDTEELAALAAALASAEAARGRGPLPSGIPAYWRNLPSQAHVRRYTTEGGREVAAAHRTVRGAPVPERPGTRVRSVAADRVVLEADGAARAFTVHTAGDRVHVETPHGSVSLTPVDPLPAPEAAVDPGALPAPMPGTVTSVDVAVGERVRAGQTLLRLEAMKMEHRITAPAAGAVREIPVAEGRRVAAGTPLAVLDYEGQDDR
ncbi:Acetyl-_propionyl-coenzyme A carboxylase alpha chain [Nocardiopsis dassonvillei]|uniref:ATP-binding protein n=1 Tax=Nocardiopsis dassonvillei TaxID=2014 RepID=UPI003F5675DA